MALDATGLFSGMSSHLRSLGLFESVGKHEPKSAPKGLSAWCWTDNIRAIRDSSLTKICVLVIFKIRTCQNFMSKPEDEIDPRLLSAVGKIMNDLAGDFTLGGAIRNIDILGEFGTELSAQAGYLKIDNTVHRIMDINVPMVVDDVWSYAP